MVDFKRRYPRGEWYIRGDFNAIKNDSKWKGVESYVKIWEMLEFNQFIDQFDLVDILVMSGKFTWINLSGYAMRKIDIFLLSDGLIAK